MALYAANREKMEAQLNVYAAQIKLLEAKIESASTDLKLHRASQVNQLRAKQREAAEKLTQMKNATSAAWEQAKATADKVWDDLKTGIANAHSDVV